MKKDTDDKHPSSAFTSFANKLHLRKTKKQSHLRQKLPKCIHALENVPARWRSYRVIHQKCEVLVQDVSADVVTTGEGPEDLIG